MRFGLLLIIFVAVSLFGQSIEIHSRLASSNLFGNEINLHLRIYNNSSEKLDLTKANLTYRFNDNASLDKFAYDIWWFSNGNASDAKISFYGDNTSEKYFKLYFSNGIIESGKYAEIQLRVYKTDWSFFSMIGDYSLPLSGTQWAPNPNIAFSNFAYEFPVLPPPNNKPVQLAFSDILLDLSDYSVFSSNEVRLADRVLASLGRTEIHGSVGTGSYAEIGADSKITGNLHSRKNAFLRERAQLLGDLRVGENYTAQNFVLIDGEKITGKPIPDFKLPSKDLKIGTTDLFIGNRETRHLEPGTYRDLTVHSNSELYLRSGKYTFRNFRLEPEAKLKLDVSGGAIEINATETVTFSDRIAVSYQNDYANPLAFKVYQHGTQDLRIGTNLSIGGYFIAPNATIRVSSRVKFAGWLHGKNIYVEPDTKICEPPMLAGLSHSKIAYGPDFSALTSEYRTAYKADDLEVFAKAKDKNSTVDIYRDGNKFKVRLYNSEKADIHPWCAQTEYSLVAGDGKNTVVYVKENLQKGLETAKIEGKAVWLAEGNYDVSKDSVLRIGMGTEIRGSFAKDGSGSLENRGGDINKTIIKGNGENTLLFLGGSGLPYAAYLDMVTVTNGNILSIYAAPILDYLVVKGNDIKAEGGGIYSVNSEGLKITNSYIVNNKSSLGGALYVDKGSLALENSIISANKAGNGAAIYAENAKLKIRHLTVADNIAQNGKGIAFVGNVNAETANNIVWGNGSTDLAVTVQNPLFKSNVAAGDDGLFFTKDDGYALGDDSPMIDKGIKQADIPLDIFQMDRTISKDGSGLPDLGAREWFPDLAKGIELLEMTTARKWIVADQTTVLSESVDEYFPLKLRNSPYTYNLSVKTPKNSHMKDKHTVEVKILDENGKNACGKTKTFTFYRIAEENGIVEYRTRRNGEGQLLFLAEKEMPSYNWYQVLKVCKKENFKIHIKVTK
ncbi:MAG: right-handed parallel beta-helix repeat-containing protein [Fibromonadaceae bacterium]|jgi:hypothetical protein|nr:right-handed parallel beta-helix repeat-containing protein [Fibromonadaceae bacterium]